MLFMAIYRVKPTVTEQSAQRSLQLFQSWKPPFEFKAHYNRCDGRGGIAIIESDRPMSLLEGIAPWTPFFEFEVSPVVDMGESVPVLDRINKWRSSIK
jgi:hypothetical protein